MCHKIEKQLGTTNLHREGSKRDCVHYDLASTLTKAVLDVLA